MLGGGGDWLGLALVGMIDGKGAAGAGAELHEPHRVGVPAVPLSVRASGSENYVGGWRM